MPAFVRILLMGGDDVTDAVAERLGVPPPRPSCSSATRPSSAQRGPGDAARIIDTQLNEFVDEIRGSVDYYLATSGSRPLARLVLSGGGSLAPGLAEKLAAAVRVPVEYGRAFASLTIGRTGLAPEQIRFVEPMAAVPVGLALGAM